MELGVHFEGYVYDAVGVLAVLVLCVCGAGNRGLNRVFFYKKKVWDYPTRTALTIHGLPVARERNSAASCAASRVA